MSASIVKVTEGQGGADMGLAAAMIPRQGFQRFTFEMANGVVADLKIRIDGRVNPMTKHMEPVKLTLPAINFSAAEETQRKQLADCIAKMKAVSGTLIGIQMTCLKREGDQKSIDAQLATLKTAALNLIAQANGADQKKKIANAVAQAIASNAAIDTIIANITAYNTAATGFIDFCDKEFKVVAAQSANGAAALTASQATLKEVTTLGLNFFSEVNDPNGHVRKVQKVLRNGTVTHDISQYPVTDLIDLKRKSKIVMDAVVAVQAHAAANLLQPLVVPPGGHWINVLHDLLMPKKTQPAAPANAGTNPQTPAGGATPSTQSPNGQAAKPAAAPAAKPAAGTAAPTASNEK